MSSISQNKAVPPAPAEQSSTILRKKTDFVFKFHVLRQPPPPKSKFLPQGLAKMREAGKKKNCKKNQAEENPELFQSYLDNLLKNLKSRPEEKKILFIGFFFKVYREVG